MKWIGQHIWDYISRFRNDVYIENLAETTQDHVVGVDSDGKLYKQDKSVGDITAVKLQDEAGTHVTYNSGQATVEIVGSAPISTSLNGSTTLTISHDDTSSQASVNNSGRTFIQDITLDTYGHVTGITSATDEDTHVGDITGVRLTADDSGVAAVSSGSADFVVTGGEGIDTSITASNEITIAGEDASTSNKGVASFSSDNFDVSSGAVTIKSGGVDLAAEVTGTLPVGNGGTGTTSYTDNQIVAYNASNGKLEGHNVFITSPSTNVNRLTIGDVSNNVSSQLMSDNGAPLTVLVDYASGSNVAGSDLTLQAGISTGTQAGGDIIFRSSPTGSAGTSPNANTQIASFDNVGNLQLDGGITTGSTSFVNSSGVIQVATQGTINHDSLANFVAAEHYRWDTDISSTATIHTNNITDLHGAGVDGSANQLLTDDGDGTITSEANLTFDSGSLQVINSAIPLITLKRTSTGSDNDTVGTIRFTGNDDADNALRYAAIQAKIIDASDGAEEGQLNLQVASHDGEEVTGLSITSGNAEDEVDVTVGNGATSLTTVAGDLTINGSTITGSATDNFTLESTAGNKPDITLKATGNHNKSPVLQFVKDKGAAGAAADAVGTMIFEGDNDAQQQTPMAGVVVQVEDATDGAEEGKFAVSVKNTSSTGTTDSFTLTGNGTATDASIGSGSASVTTIAGTLTMGSTAALDNSGVLQVGAQTNITSLGTLTSGLNIGSASYTGDGVTVTGSDSDNTYDVFVGKRKFPRITLIDDAATGDTEFQIWNLGDELRIGTNASTHGNAALVVHDGNAALVEVQDDLLVNGEIQLGNASDTTIARSAAGTVTIEGKEILTNDSGTVTVSAGTSGDATLIIEADTDNNNEDDLPRLWFRADAINEGAIQLQDNTLDIINNVSANGGIRFLTGTTNNTGTTDPSTSATERMSISSQGLVTVAGALESNTIELGHASDTTISRVSAGVAAIENQLIVTSYSPLLASSGSSSQTMAELMSRRTLTTAEMNDLHNTPIQVALGGGNNTVIVPTGGMIRVDRASTNSGSGSLDFHYNGVTASYGTTSLVHFRRFMNNVAADRVFPIVPNGAGVTVANSLTEDVNKAIEVSLTSACTTDCFTSVDIFLTYKVITIA